MKDPILVTSEEFWTLMWMVYNVALFHIAHTIFAFPDEVTNDSDY